MIGLSKCRNILLLSSCCTQLISQFAVGSKSLSESHTVSFVLKSLTLVLHSHQKTPLKNHRRKGKHRPKQVPIFLHRFTSLSAFNAHRVLSLKKVSNRNRNLVLLFCLLCSDKPNALDLKLNKLVPLIMLSPNIVSVNSLYFSYPGKLLFFPCSSISGMTKFPLMSHKGHGSLMK